MGVKVGRAFEVVNGNDMSVRMKIIEMTNMSEIRKVDIHFLSL